MYELVYADSRKDYDEMAGDVRCAFPDLRIEDASDDVHPFRFCVRGDVAEDIWWPWAIREGVFMATLGGQLMASMEPDRVRGYIEAANPKAKRPREAGSD